MKHAHKLRNLLNAALYCAEADNETKMREIWNNLKLAEQISALVNVQIFDEWQTLEKAEFVLQRANEVLSEYRDLADIINRNPTAKGLFYSSSQWRELELCLMEEHAELTMCMVSKNMQTTLPKQAPTPEPATEPKQGNEGVHDELLEKIMHDVILAPRFKDYIIIDDFGRTHKDSAAEILRNIINVGLAAQAKGKKRWKDEIKKEIDKRPNNHNLEELDYKSLERGFKYYGLEIGENAPKRWKTEWNDSKGKKRCYSK